MKRFNYLIFLLSFLYCSVNASQRPLENPPTPPSKKTKTKALVPYIFILPADTLKVMTLECPVLDVPSIVAWSQTCKHYRQLYKAYITKELKAACDPINLEYQTTIRKKEHGHLTHLLELEKHRFFLPNYSNTTHTTLKWRNVSHLQLTYRKSNNTAFVRLLAKKANPYMPHANSLIKEICTLNRPLALKYLTILCKRSPEYATSAVDQKNNTPLHVAARMHECDMVRTLLFHKANKEALNNKSQTPVALAIEHAPAIFDEKRQYIASYSKHLNSFLQVIDMLTSHNVPLSKKEALYVAKIKDELARYQDKYGELFAF